MRLTILYGVGLFATILYGCQSVEVISIPTVEPKLVVNFIGNTDTPLSGRITVSHGVLDNYIPTVPEATVMIYEDGILKETLPPPDNNGDIDGYSGVYYSGNTIPAPGKTYSIKVESPSYNTASSTYIQPLPVEIDNFKLTYLNRSGNHLEGYDAQVEFSFTDIQGKNYYQAFIGGRQKNDMIDMSFPVVPTSIDHKYSYWPNGTEIPYILFDDSGIENKLTTVIFKAFTEYGSDVDEKYPVEYTVYLRNITEEYYKYLVTYNIQYSTQGDPYAQPVKVENNIANGFGIFGGATHTAKTITVSH